MDYKRPDGRLPNELRDTIISFDGLDGVDGSARFGFGDTKALSSVSGPIEVRLAVEQANKATFEVLLRPLAGLPGTDSKALASALRSALIPSIILTTNPRTLVQLVALALAPIPHPPPTPRDFSGDPTQSRNGRRQAQSILRTGPSLVSTLINASSLALLNASSVPLRGVVCACSVGRIRSTSTEDSILIIDPSESELGPCDGAGTFAFLITGSKSHSSSSPNTPEDQTEHNEQKKQKLRAELVWSHWNATPFDEGDLAHATELARAGALRVRESMREAIERALFGDSSKDKRVEVKKEDPLDDGDGDAKMEIS